MARKGRVREASLSEKVQAARRLMETDPQTETIEEALRLIEIADQERKKRRRGKEG